MTIPVCVNVCMNNNCMLSLNYFNKNKIKENYQIISMHSTTHIHSIHFEIYSLNSLYTLFSIQIYIHHFLFNSKNAQFFSKVLANITITHYESLILFFR